MSGGNANLTPMEWHERYAHLPFPAFSQISEAPVHLRYSKLQCSTCMKTKSMKPLSPVQEIRASMVGELVHSTLHGPFHSPDISGNQYMITLVDDFSRLTITRAIQEKSDVPVALQEMILKFESMTECSIENLWTNWGAEFRSHKFLLWLKQKHIVPSLQ